MLGPPLSAANLHDPILPLVRPVPVTLTADQSIADALRVVRTSISAANIHYFYVVDDQRRLIGVVPARHLLAADPAQRVDEVMIHDVVAIPSWATVLVASEYFASRKLLAFPVIHDNGELVGVVDVGLFTSEVIDLARRTYDDIFQLWACTPRRCGRRGPRSWIASRGCCRTSRADCCARSSPRSSRSCSTTS